MNSFTSWKSMGGLDMRSLLALDPGINFSGVAIFQHSRLVEARPLRNPAPVDANILQRTYLMVQTVADYVVKFKPLVTSLAVEWPQVYSQGKGKGDPNDLPHLAAIAGGVAAYIGAFAQESEMGVALIPVKPREWKGQLTKAACHRRIEDHLDEHERDIWKHIVGRGSTDARDAVGIGLYVVKRFEPFRVLPGATEVDNDLYDS